MALNHMELDILRYLYGPQNTENVIAKYKGRYPDKAIFEILSKHLRIGSIVRHKNKLMSIFNDPGFLETIEEQNYPEAIESDKSIENFNNSMDTKQRHLLAEFTKSISRG